MLKDLSGKTVYDLDREDFEKLFCRQCKESGICGKDEKAVHICMGLLDAGTWDLAFRKCH